MTLDKSLLTDIVLLLGIVIAFITTYLRRRNIKFSLLFSAFYICCYSLFTNYFLPFSLEFNPIFEFDKDFTVANLFIMPDFSNIADYFVMFLTALFMGVFSPMLFKKCRSLKGSIRMLAIPFGMNIFFFIIDLIMGGLYQYVDFMNIIVFALGFYIAFFPVTKLFSNSFAIFDYAKKGKKSVNYDSVI